MTTMDVRFNREMVIKEVVEVKLNIDPNHLLILWMKISIPLYKEEFYLLY